MGEHDDDLEMPELGEHTEALRIAAAVASGLEQIAAALERGLHEVASAIAAGSAGRRGRPHRAAGRGR